MAEQTTHTLPLREEVPAKDKWHIEDIFSNDDAFTVQFSAMKLNTNFTTVPTLTVSSAFPVGTTIIMQTNGKYYWKKIGENSSTTEIGLSSFKEMGTKSTEFDHSQTVICSWQVSSKK